MFRITKSKTGGAKSARRREELRKSLPKSAFDPLAVLQRPEFIHTALILISFLVVMSFLVVWSRDQVKVRDGQIMTQPRVKRLSYTVLDATETAAKREEARKNSPRIYTRNDSYLGRVEATLIGLPKAVAGKTSLEEISEDLRREFQLTEADLQALQAAVHEGEPSSDWSRWVNRLVHEQLVRNPLIKSQEYQIYITTLNKGLLLSTGELEQPIRGEPIQMPADSDDPPDPRLQEIVTRAGFPQQLVPVVLKRLTWDLQPVFLVSEEETTNRANQAAESVQPVQIQNQAGELLYRPGQKLTDDQHSDVVVESERYANAPPEIVSRWERWSPRLGVIGLISIVTLFIGGFAAIAYPRITENPFRIAAISTLMSGMLAVTVLVTAYAPIFLVPAAIGPTLFVAIIILVAYDQRLALLLGGIQCMLVSLALEQSIGFFIVLLAGCAAAVAQLREVRHRNSLIQAATATAAVLGVGTVLLGLLEMPLVEGAKEQILVMGLSAVLTSYGVGFLVLGILPSIERLFDITTGMTLAELRDPKRPLLRQLQLRAPGTYNHSLQVANISEAAAEAIGADSLLVYVGALYHDVGKINKPEYFVENQSGGQNKHQKLSPAMSLLVIIGHVKNGIELAREYGVPRQIQHFIESHHGTTLVEYFYHAAKAKSEITDAGPSVQEVEYRYPGPKPQTKEAAILMLADAVESATRAMAEPNPSRIETLVRKLSAKRLEDGQFDQCDLTFRELALIEDAIINRVMAIYHSRISYPTGISGGSGTRPAEPPEVQRSPQPRPVSA
jgi:putative nucleotidyltransferase with HDIG domain